MGLPRHRRPGQARQHLAQTKQAIEAVCGFGQMAQRIFSLTDGVVTAAYRAFDIAKHHVFPEAGAANFSGQRANPSLA